MKKILLSVLILLIVISLGFYIYVSDYYRVDGEAVEAFLPSADIEERILDGGNIAYIPDGARAGIIFYPGGKVEYTAYTPLMRALAERGILAVLVKMPHNLAVLKQGAADGIREEFADIESWYMAGHSLGGSMAASYISKNADTFDGLILLAAYSTADLTDSGLYVSSIYGSEEGVMNREKYGEYMTNLPTGTAETVIDGGNHAGFGMYGEQKGDGQAKISAAEQIGQTAEIIEHFISSKEIGEG